MTYKGIVKGSVIELEKGVQLPEGMTVKVIVKEQDTEPLAPSGYPKGSPQAILAAITLFHTINPPPVYQLPSTT